MAQKKSQTGVLSYLRLHESHRKYILVPGCAVGAYCCPQSLHVIEFACPETLRKMEPCRTWNADSQQGPIKQNFPTLTQPVIPSAHLDKRRLCPINRVRRSNGSSIRGRKSRWHTPICRNFGCVFHGWRVIITLRDQKEAASDRVWAGSLLEETPSSVRDAPPPP